MLLCAMSRMYTTGQFFYNGDACDRERDAMVVDTMWNVDGSLIFSLRFLGTGAS
jgi:hypothetical protein